MTVKRIVPNIASDRIASAKAFYGDILGMEVAMDFGWIVTFASDAPATPRISVAAEGGSTSPSRTTQQAAEPVTSRRINPRSASCRAGCD